MTTISEMKGYIDRTKIRNEDRYGMRMSDIFFIYEMIGQDAYRAICLAFEYGRAKGYRAAKKEVTA